MDSQLMQDANGRVFDKNASLVILSLLSEVLSAKNEFIFTSLEIYNLLLQNGISFNFYIHPVKTIDMRLLRLYQQDYLGRVRATKRNRWKNFPKYCKFIYFVNERLKNRIENRLTYLENKKNIEEEKSENNKNKTKFVTRTETNKFIGEI